MITFSRRFRPTPPDNISHAPRTSPHAALSRSQISPIHASCSGFIRTERRQVTTPSSFVARSSIPNHDPGNCTSARCSPRAAHASNTLRVCSDASPRVCCMQRQCPHHNVQLRQTWRVPRVPRIWGPGKRCPQSYEPRVCPHSPVQFHRRSPPLRQPLRKLPARHKRQQPLRRPQRYRRRSRTRALQADLAKMQAPST